MKKGFTLIEMIVAILLSTLVLLGIIAVAASMVRQHFESLAQGELSGQTLLSLDEMNRQIENASALVAPAPGGNANGGNGDDLSFCVNWYNNSAGGNPPFLSSVQPVYSYYYCAAPTAAPAKDANPGADDLWGYTCEVANPSLGGNICPFPGLAGGCGRPGSAPAGCSGPMSVLYNSLYFEGPPYPHLFYAVPGGIQLHYIVGDPAPTAKHPAPVSMQVDNVIMMQKAIGDSKD
ncbi:MAG: prepilin-type N-terminal cleavage/methylation domain-containing protein [Elusimicrobia bacterium]|nr:prepilin-type N-terminal cleavage/methylation domain-containing protein [Elusimicrobiota bacterium]